MPEILKFEVGKMRRCTKCKKLKHESCFSIKKAYVEKGYNDGFSYECYKCMTDRQKDYYAKMSQEKKKEISKKKWQRVKNDPEALEKQRKSCREYIRRPEVKEKLKKKRSTQDYKDKRNKERRERYRNDPEYREQKRARDREYNSRPEVKEKLKKKRSTQDYKDAKNKKRRDRYRDDPVYREEMKNLVKTPQGRASKRKCMNKRYREDEMFKLRVIYRASVNRYAQDFAEGIIYNANRLEYYEDLVGCTQEEFLEWLHNNEYGLTVMDCGTNPNDATLDHIVPLSLAEDEDEYRALSHYSNLRLIPWSENASKGNKLLHPDDMPGYVHKKAMKIYKRALKTAVED